MLKAIILDDEPESILALQIKLKSCNTAVEVVETLTDSRSLPSLLKQHFIDVLFLDVEMPGLNGLALLDLLEDRNFEVVLVTAYSEYALKAIKASALDYLMKPVDVDELEAALQKVTKRRPIEWKDRHIAQKLSDLTTILEHANKPVYRLALSSLNETYYIAPNQIVYIAGENNYSTFYLIDAREIVVSKTLKEYEGLLSPKQFFRVHKSYLVNLDHIKKLNKGLELSLSMANNVDIEIAYRKKAEFLRVMKERTK